MRVKRLVWFFLMILLGALLGMAYGWLIRPMGRTANDPQTLRSDYKADYSLMVSEIYRQDGDLGAARQRLALFGDVLPEQTLTEAIITAQQLQYAPPDIEAMVMLVQALQTTLTPTDARETTLTPAPLTGTPSSTTEAQP